MTSHRDPFSEKAAAARARRRIASLRRVVDSFENDWADIDTCLQGATLRCQIKMSDALAELEGEIDSTVPKPKARRKPGASHGE